MKLPPRPRWSRDPGLQALAVLVALAAVGFVMLGLSWRGGARTQFVPLQVPWLVSGGFAGLALLGLALGAVSIHLSRRDDAADRAAYDRFTRDLAALADELRASGRPRRRRQGM